MEEYEGSGICARGERFKNLKGLEDLKGVEDLVDINFLVDLKDLD